MSRPSAAATERSTASIETGCCIAGGGPAGMMLGYLLARAGVPVRVLEKHSDFLRDFRGDTVHPSTLAILGQIDLLPAFEQLPQQRVRHLELQIGGRTQPVIDFRGLRPFDHLALVPQWDFLELLAREARMRYPHFALHLRHEATALIEHGGRVRGVQVDTPDGPRRVLADVVVACDGRASRLRAAAGLAVEDLGAPMDVLWFRLPRGSDDPAGTFAIVGQGRMMVLLNRADYWQAAYVVPKGSDRELRAEPLQRLCERIAGLAPFLRPALPALRSWDDVKTLAVQVDRLRDWARPGLLVIGDAAHAMSPIGGVGINLAIQDAVAAANALGPALRRDGPVALSVLRRVQQRREAPTRLIQALQLQAQRRLIARVIGGEAEPQLPGWLRLLLRWRCVRRVPAWLIGYGPRRERVRLAEQAPRGTR